MVGLMAQYGLALIFANVLIQQIGLPIPVVPTLLVAGSLAADGKFAASAIFAVALAACAISDATWYAAGRRYGRRVIRVLCRISLLPDSCVQQSEYHFQRWGRFTLVLAKFVPGLPMIMPVLAGTTRFGFWSFMLLDALGAAMWVGVAIGSGILFHRQIGHLIGQLQELGAVAIGAIGIFLAGYCAKNVIRRTRESVLAEVDSLRLQHDAADVKRGGSVAGA